MITHVMKCGCKLLESELVVVRTKYGQIRNRVCPKHNKPVDHRLTYCISCGEIVKQSKSGILSEYCKNDRILHGREITKKHRIRLKEQNG